MNLWAKLWRALVSYLAQRFEPQRVVARAVGHTKGISTFIWGQQLGDYHHSLGLIGGAIQDTYSFDLTDIGGPTWRISAFSFASLITAI